MATVILR